MLKHTPHQLTQIFIIMTKTYKYGYTFEHLDSFNEEDNERIKAHRVLGHHILWKTSRTCVVHYPTPF